MVEGPLQRMPGGDRVVPVHHLAGDSKRPAAVDNVPFTMLTIGARRNAPAVVFHHEQGRQDEEGER